MKAIGSVLCLLIIAGCSSGGSSGGSSTIPLETPTVDDLGEQLTDGQWYDANGELANQIGNGLASGAVKRSDVPDIGSATYTGYLEYQVKDSSNDDIYALGAELVAVADFESDIPVTGVLGNFIERFSPEVKSVNDRAPVEGSAELIFDEVVKRFPNDPNDVTVLTGSIDGSVTMLNKNERILDFDSVVGTYYHNENGGSYLGISAENDAVNEFGETIIINGRAIEE